MMRHECMIFGNKICIMKCLLPLIILLIVIATDSLL